MVSNHSRTSHCSKPITGLFLALVFLASFNRVSSGYSPSSFYSSPDEYYYTGGWQVYALRGNSGQGQSGGLKSPALKQSADLDFEDAPNQNTLDVDDYDLNESGEEENEVTFSCAYLILQCSCQLILVILLIG